MLDEVINYLYQNDLSPHSIQKNILDSLYSILDDKWKKVIDQGHELIDKIFVEYFFDLSQDELSNLFVKYKGQFHLRTMRLKLLIGKAKEVEKNMHLIAKNIVGVEQRRQ